jgi:hypothetical protein
VSRKDYVAIAAAIKEVVDSTDNINIHDHLHHVVRNLCSVFAADNPHFDRARFIVACGLLP